MAWALQMDFDPILTGLKEANRGANKIVLERHRGHIARPAN
jgi:hypothetical protein